VHPPRFIAIVAAVGSSVVAPLVVTASPAHAGGGCHRTPQTEGAGDTVELAANCMNPTVLRTSAGTTVTFVNRDSWEHNVFGASWGDDQLLGGERFTRRFGEEGVYPFACLIHAGMVGAIVVEDAAPVAVERAAATAPAPEDGGTNTAAIAVLVGLIGGGLVLGVRTRRRALAARRSGPPATAGR
jgi:plastocyanin